MCGMDDYKIIKIIIIKDSLHSRCNHEYFPYFYSSLQLHEVDSTLSPILQTGKGATEKYFSKVIQQQVSAEPGFKL